MPKDREGLEKLTVVALRELAKKRLGTGTSKLRTKAQLLAALGEAGNPPAKGLPGKSRAKSPKTPEASKQPRRSNVKAAPKQARTEKAPLKTAPHETALTDLAPPKKAAPKKTTPAQSPRKPRRSLERSPENGSEIDGVAASSDLEPLQALPLEGETMLVRWGAVAIAVRGESWELEVSSDGRTTRILPVAPQARRAYVRSLLVGPVYRAKLVARGPGGRRRPIGGISRPVVFFPPAEPGAILQSGERFVRYAWSDPLASVQGPGHTPPGTALGSESEGSAPGLEAGAGDRSATSPVGALARPALGWLSSARSPTSFAN